MRDDRSVMAVRRRNAMLYLAWGFEVKTMSTAPPSGRPLLAAIGERSSEHGTIPPALHGEALGLASLLANGTRDGIAIVGPDGKLVLWNAAAGAITGWSTQSIAERNVAKLMQVPQALIEIRDGKWVEIRQSTLEADGKSFVVVIFTDATSQVRLKDTREQLRALGLIDTATNLPGREVAMLHVEQAIAMAKRDKRSVGLLSLKLDRFRQLRDGADGHAAADEVIRQFAKRITAFVRASDVPARLADDSFLVVLTALTSSNDAAVVAVRLLLVLAEPFDVIGHARTVHCSIGVAETPRDAADAVTLLGASLAAADRAQLQGGGRYCVASDPLGAVSTPTAAASAGDGAAGARDVASERADIARRINR
jgi:diguanylate cyclase (GGDEF)-like protein